MRYPLPVARLALALVGFHPAGSLAQSADTLRLSLADALRDAAGHHPGVIQAAAARRVAEADLLAGSAAFLPRLHAEVGVLRSSDPVAAFGIRLRQARFTQADFAVDLLNRPGPITDVSTTLTLEQPLFEPEGLLGRRAASRAVRAAGALEERTGQLARLEVIRAYFGARFAADRVAVLDAALVAARRTLTQVQSFRRNGTVTVVDEQLARARVSELESSLAGGRVSRDAAADELFNLLGQPGGRPLMLLDTLAVPADPGPAPNGALSERADVAALAEALDAADASVSRAKGSWLPSAGAFGSVGFHAPDVGIARGPGRWTAGVVLRWTPFRGLADLGRLHRAEAERDAMQERLAAARRQAETEVRTARAEQRAAAAEIAAADDALAGAELAERVASVRYAEGVGTITELLAVRAAEAAQRLARVHALYQARVADATLAVALGKDPS